MGKVMVPIKANMIYLVRCLFIVYIYLLFLFIWKTMQNSKAALIVNCIYFGFIFYYKLHGLVK